MRREQAGEKFSMPGARRNRKAEEKEAGGPLKANRGLSGQARKKNEKRMREGLANPHPFVVI